MRKILSVAAMLPFFLWGCALLRPNNNNEDLRQSQVESPAESSANVQTSIVAPASPAPETLAPSALSPNGAHAQPTKAQIRIAQQRLKAAGMNPGPSDGVLGPKTKAALKRYQSQHGISATGALDEVTLQSLGAQ